MHGVLMDVLGIGVLLLGKSGIGKSETALDLVVRGHRLVADDVIEIRRQGAHVVGRGAGIIGHHMEIRGLGIINIKDLFGISAVRDTKKIELVVELREWDEHEEYDRLGFDDQFDRILDVAVPAVQLPVRPGRNLATLIEVAARNQLLKLQGTHSARAFRDQLHQRDGGAVRGHGRRTDGRGGVDADRDRHRAVGRRQEHGAARARGHRVLLRRQHPGAAGRADGRPPRARGRPRQARDRDRLAPAPQPAGVARPR